MPLYGPQPGNVTDLFFFASELNTSAAGYGSTPNWWGTPDVELNPNPDGFCGASYLVPPGWNTVNVNLVYSVTNTGNVAWEFQYGSLAVGTSIATPLTSIGGVQILPESTANVIKTLTLVTGVAVTANQFETFNIIRRGTDVADVNTGYVGLLGVRLTKAT